MLRSAWTPGKCFDTRSACRSTEGETESGEPVMTTAIAPKRPQEGPPKRPMEARPVRSCRRRALLASPPPSTDMQTLHSRSAFSPVGHGICRAWRCQAI